MCNPVIVDRNCIVLWVQPSPDQDLGKLYLPTQGDHPCCYRFHQEGGDIYVPCFLTEERLHSFAKRIGLQAYNSVRITDSTGFRTRAKELKLVITLDPEAIYRQEFAQ